MSDEHIRKTEPQRRVPSVAHSKARAPRRIVEITHPNTSAYSVRKLAQLAHAALRQSARRGA
jgi:hypothetical protein